MRNCQITQGFKQMCKTNNLSRDVQHDIQMARKKFEGYEKLYMGLAGDGKKYLRNQSKEYKNTVLDVQQIILPSVEQNCPSCINCCKLYTPELNVYIAGSLGCFDFIDYILVRCDTVLPDPIFKNMEHNLCAFWAEGCILSIDCRSFLCIKYFCDDLKKEIDMNVIAEYLDTLKSVIDSFSIQKCLGINK